MEEWEAMRVLKAAHEGGLATLDSLEQAARQLKDGRMAEAIEVFERAIQFFEGDLKMHFEHEERALFPVLGRIIGRAGPIGAMVAEHESLWRCIDDFVEEVEYLRVNQCGPDGHRIVETERLAKHIVWMLRGHIEKEDTMLFPLAERTLDARGKSEVLANMQMVELLQSHR